MEHRLDEALKDDVAGIGWSRARELNSVTEWAQFKAVLRIHYPEFYVGQERAFGNAAGSLWRFLFDVRLGDVVLIPVDRGFFVGEVKSHAWFEERLTGVTHTSISGILVDLHSSFPRKTDVA